jgi:hypothetical protein
MLIFAVIERDIMLQLFSSWWPVVVASDLQEVHFYLSITTYGLVVCYSMPWLQKHRLTFSPQ